MSSLIVEVCTVDAVDKHPNADKMCVCSVKGWKVCTALNADGNPPYQAGDSCVYIPPDSILTKEFADRIGVTKYLVPLPVNEKGERTGYRVRVAKLRGFPSFGLIVKPEQDWEVGKDVSSILNITKYEPPLDCTNGDAEKDCPAFHHYFDLENWENFPDVIKEGEEVVMTEKIHGMNCRVGLIRDTDNQGKPIFRFMAGSHNVRRKEFQAQRKRREDAEGEWFYEDTRRSQFWQVLDDQNIKRLLFELCQGQHNVIIFGEIYGDGVQDMTYGLELGRKEFRVFDIAVDGKYLDCDEKFGSCRSFGVPTVLVLYQGPFSKNIVQKYVSGPTNMCAPEKAGRFKGREGVVITTVQEHPTTTEKKVFERTALKAVSFDYLERKEGSEYH